MADTSTFDVQKALDAGVSEDKIFDFLTKNNPQFDASKAVQSGQSRRNVIDFLAKQPPNTDLSFPPLRVPNAPIKKADAQGLNIPNRVPNDPRLIPAQEMGGENGVIPHAQTLAGIMATAPISGVLGGLGAGAAMESPEVATALAKLKNLMKTAGTGAAIGGASGAIAGHDPMTILKNALEGGVLGTAGGTITSKLRDLFSKGAPEAEAAMSEVPPVKTDLPSPFGPKAVTSLPNTNGISGTPLATGNTNTAAANILTPTVQRPNPLTTLFQGGGSTNAIPLGGVPPTGPVSLPTEPTIGRSLVTGKFLPQGTKLADHLSDLSESELKTAYDKLQGQANAQDLRNKIVEAFKKLKEKTK